MKRLERAELCNVVGGGNEILIGIAIAAIVIFLSGVIRGYTNPERCE